MAYVLDFVHVFLDCFDTFLFLVSFRCVFELMVGGVTVIASFLPRPLKQKIAFTFLFSRQLGRLCLCQAVLDIFVVATAQVFVVVEWNLIL